MKKSNNKGFTLVELIATIVILALIVGIVILVCTGVINLSKKKSYAATRKNIIEAATAYATEYADYLVEECTTEEGMEICIYKVSMEQLLDAGYFDASILEELIEDEDGNEAPVTPETWIVLTREDGVVKSASVVIPKPGSRASSSPSLSSSPLLPSTPSKSSEPSKPNEPSLPSVSSSSKHSYVIPIRDCPLGTRKVNSRDGTFWCNSICDGFSYYAYSYVDKNAARFWKKEADWQLEYECKKCPLQYPFAASIGSKIEWDDGERESATHIGQCYKCIEEYLPDEKRWDECARKEYFANHQYCDEVTTGKCGDKIVITKEANYLSCSASGKKYSYTKIYSSSCVERGSNAVVSYNEYELVE